MKFMEKVDIDIGAKKPIDGTQVFLVGRYSSGSDAPFVLLYDSGKRRRAKRNIQKIDPLKIVAAIGTDQFIEVQYPDWGTAWFRASKIRGVRELTSTELNHSPAKFGSMVLFEHDPEPEDEHAGFLLFGIEADRTSEMLNQRVKNEGSLPVCKMPVQHDE
jgi:hypothetical protein